MFAANTYRIRLATDDDSDALRSLAERNSQQPLDGQVLVGEIDGQEAAAISLSDGRVIGDSSDRTNHLVANLRVRAVATWAQASTPSLHDRLLAGLPAWYRAVSTSTSSSAETKQEPELVGG